jgi:SAM-dependent methyltransferase
VGCGVGDNATALAKKGYNVIGVTPDKYQHKILRSINHNNIDFKLTKFEDFKTTKKFDCILMSESSHYFRMETGLEKSRDLLIENGYLLVANIFRKRQSKAFSETHIEPKWVQCAEDYGFKVTKRQDITQNVLPTLVFGEKMYNEYLAPIGEIIDVYFKKTSPTRAKIIEFLFSKDINRLFSLKNYLFEHLNSKIFCETARYLIFLLQLDKNQPK